jgi:general secretion pathway protein D
MMTRQAIADQDRMGPAHSAHPTGWLARQTWSSLAGVCLQLGCLSVLLPGVMTPMAHAQSSQRSGTVTMNFVNAEIEGVARAVSAIVNRQIIVDPRVKGTVTLYSEQPVTPREAYMNFLSALRGQGFALVEVSGLLKVVPEADAKLQSGTVDVGNKPQRTGDVILTQIFKLQFENANSMVTVLRPLISPNNTINANPGTNTLVITDYADNLKRMGQIIAALDVPSTGDMEIIPLQHTVASDLVAVVQRFNAADTGGGAAGSVAQPVVIQADARTNALLVKAPNAARLASIKKLVTQLDRPGETGVGGSGIHVVYLKNADAVKLAQILRAAFPTGSGASGGGGTSVSAPATPTPTASNTGNSASGASTQSTAPVGSSAGPSTGGNIQADPASNSLIITAPDALYRQLRAVIDRLDGRRAQLYIEAMIVEVNADKFAQVGVQWQTILGKEGDKNLIGIGTNLPTSTTNTTIPSLLSSTNNAAALATAKGLNIGVAHDFGDGQYGLAALASFLQTNADGNILSSPNLVVLDNEEAKIVSGQNVPVPSGQTSVTGGTANPFTTIDRKDVGLTLRVKPQIGENGTIRMTVFQENSAVQSVASDGPTTSKSSLETSVVVDDGTLLVLGGLIKEDTKLTTSKVPVLGDIPVLGRLFRSEGRDRKRSNLMVFLRPVIMRTQDVSNAVTAERYQYMQQQQRAISPEESLLLPIDGGNRLPTLNLPSTSVVPSPFLPQAPASVAPKP